MSKSESSKKFYNIEYKQKIIQEYLSGNSNALEIAQREGIQRGQIYKWRVQLEELKNRERVGLIQTEDPNLTYVQARRIRELEEELDASQKKMAQLMLENDLLGDLVKKTNPNSLYARKLSGFAEVKATLRLQGRAK